MAAGHDSPVNNFSLGSGLAQKKRPLEVALEYDFEPFFEFIRFVYTDDVVITLGNTIGLLSLAENFRIDSLSELCMTFLHGEVKKKAYFEYEVGSGAFGSLSAAVAKALAKIKTHKSVTKKQVKADEGYDQPTSCVKEKVLITAVTDGPNAPVLHFQRGQDYE